MGQAFDSEGHVLGDATGATKREVFDQLEKAHPDAAEIRIRSIHDGAEMPRYRCHKEVQALKIATIAQRATNGFATLSPADEAYASFQVSPAYIQKHNPVVGGYFVLYKDGYQSFSPAKEFEDGYTRI